MLLLLIVGVAFLSTLFVCCGRRRMGTEGLPSLGLSLPLLTKEAPWPAQACPADVEQTSVNGNTAR